MPLELSIRERILLALFAALNAGAEKPGPAYRSRVEALAKAELPAYVLFAMESAPDRKGPHVTYHELTFRIECLMSGEPPMDAALDPMLVYAVQTMFSACEPLGLVKQLDEGPTQWEIESAYENVAIATVDFRVTFATAAADPTTEARTP